MIDHRSSPGIPRDMALANGLPPDQLGEGKLFEAASLNCKHCKTSVLKNPLRTRERSHCRSCDHYICDVCAYDMTQPGYIHTPFEKRMDDTMRLAALGSPFKLLTP